MDGKHLQFGGLSIDPVAYGSQGSAILGIRDSGKTYTATWFAEHVFEAGIPFIAFDPIGVWRFLRVPGGGRGYPVVIAGGQEGDLPLTVSSAPEIVRAAMANGVSLVIDLFDIKLSKADWKRIVTACVRVLLHENAQHGLRHVFIEEAAEFAPQRVGPDQGQVYAEIEKLARMGGNSRLGYTLINQRAEEVNKAVLELCDNLFLHRQKGRNSLTALSKWLDIGNVADAKAIVGTLSTLPTGECWAWLAGTETPVRVNVPAKNSLHPDRRIMRGDASVKSKAAVSVEAFVDTLKASLGKFEQETAANDPARLKAEIARLTRELVAKPAQAAPDPAAIDTAEARGYARARENFVWQMEHFEKRFSDAIDDLRLDLRGSIAAAGELAGSPSGKASGFGPDTAGSSPAPAATSPVRRLKRDSTNHAKTEVSGDRPTLTNPQNALLATLAWWLAMGHAEPTRAQIAAKVGWKVGGSNLRNRFADLSGLGLIEYPSTGLVRLTDAGRAAAPEPDIADTLIESIRRELTNPQRMLFDVLVTAGGPRSREQLGEALDWEPGGSNLRNRLADLSARELIRYPGKGIVELQEWVR